MPVRHFEVDGLADVVVIAGPNGVGKTRLMQRLIQLLRGDLPVPTAKAILESTTGAETEAWGKTTLDLSQPGDIALYRTTLHINRRRRSWQSSVLQFESDRSIQNLQPLQFGWDMPDPLEEDLGWDFGFGFWKTRWQDTVHAMFRMIEHQKQSIATQAVRLRREGYGSMNLNFADPIEPFKDVFSQLLAPKELVDLAARRQTLEYRVDGQVFDISTLSSGEREVINIAFDFLLRRPSDCIVFFDEPELHLHPELSHRLIQTLQRIGARNQFVLSTHSPDVIAGSLDKSVVFVSPPRVSEDGLAVNQAIPVSEDDETNQALRLLGHSIGIITLGKKIVLVEGTHSSLDKEVYGSLVRARYPGLVLVPSGGKHVIESFDAVHNAVLSKSIWGVEFFMLCDRDSVPPESDASDRLKVLSRYHLENYFLDEHVWAEVFKGMEGPSSWLRDPSQIRMALRELAEPLVGYAAALATSAIVRQSAGSVDIMPKGVHAATPEDVVTLLGEAAASECHRLANRLDRSLVEAAAEQYARQLRESLNADDERWKIDIPGKPLLAKFAGRCQMHPGRLRKLYLVAGGDETGVFKEVFEIFDAFANS
jgi:ABC-type lipoprotein export system ATPase subunit